MATLLPRQSIIQQAVDVKSTFSSWDGCMAKSYCKWPAIIGIVVGALIVISLLWCISRCICCGKDLVCCCCRCCGRNKGHKHLDSVPSTPHNNQQQYQSHGAPVYAGPGAFSQTATFDGATKVHADSLPAMPSWDTAASRKVEVIEEAAPESHEMDRLRTNASPAPRSDTTSPLARPIPMQDRAGSPYGSRTNLSSPGYGGATAGAQPGYGEDRYGSNPYGAAPRSPALPGYAASSPSSPYGPATPSNDRYGAGASPYGASSNPYGGSAPSYGGANAHESKNPYGGSNAYGGNSNGYGGNSGGYGGNSSSYDANSSPYGSSTNAYGGGSNAYGGSSNARGGGGASAYGGNSASYGNNNRYGGGNASNSPYGQYNSRPAGNGWRDI